jgi:hypothetical protein
VAALRRFYGQVEGWLSRANEAVSNPAYWLDVQVPAELPEWVEAEPCPREHLQAMLAACRRLRRHADVARGRSKRPRERREPPRSGSCANGWR